ncbi:putative quinol monooxygenase [Marinobacterium jannaschii]|uniref:putative quinol monooxygenase n=1 Tax=Marinobacterium jannaschii TaxID=64970 RepID=UPI00055FC8F3|nr:putative quinol monooxygenase [Marinobacterium jannaschii]
MLTIVARISVDPARIEAMKQAMTELVAATRQEPGCILYQLHQDNQQPERFIFTESWHSHALWRQHMEGAAVADFNAGAADGITGFELQQLTPVA